MSIERLAGKIVAGAFGTKPVCFFMLLLLCHQAVATDFPMLDARTAGLAGVSVANSISNAAFYNPALAALEPERYEWYLLAPSVGEFISDPANIETTLEQSGDVADIINQEYQKYAYQAIQLTIPSPKLAGSLYVAQYEYVTAKVLDESGSTNLVNQSLEVQELGFSAAQLQDILWMENVLVGITGKISLYKSYAYSEPIATASLELDDSQAVRDSELNMDIGFSKEYGVWKTAIVFKNLFSQDNQLGNSTETFSTGPKIRAGFAYQSRRSLIEFDIDLLKNEGVGFESDTMFAALGWEWHMFRAFSLRLGYRQNMVGDNQAMVTGGIGLQIWALQLDAAASADDEGEGVYMQAAWEF